MYSYLVLLEDTKTTHAEGVAESMGNYVDFYSEIKGGWI